MQTNELNTIVQHYAGSLSYGTNLPTSDVDIRGVFCANPVNIRTPFFPVREVNLPDQEDGKLHELSNFMQLYTQCNPNILETLWVDSSDIIQSNEVYDYLRSQRAELLSSKVAFTFSGYAISQLKRIKGHNKWINNPQPEDEPRHKDFLKMIFNHTDTKIMPRDFDVTKFTDLRLTHYGNDIFGLVNTTQKGCEVLDIRGDFNISAKQQEEVDKSKNTPSILFKYLGDEYRQAKEKHYNYWTWKNNRNEKRSALEEDFGYDTKHAMHLVRLLRMGEEVLSGNGVIVKRPDAQELLAIRGGAWKYEELLEYAETKDKLIRGELYKNTSLCKAPDLKLASKVLMEAQDMCWKGCTIAT